jgi:hypothetical protein
MTPSSTCQLLPKLTTVIQMFILKAEKTPNVTTINQFIHSIGQRRHGYVYISRLIDKEGMEHTEQSPAMRVRALNNLWPIALLLVHGK